MTYFYKNFLRDGRGWFRAARPAVHLAAFGKHPGWDDHMDDLGLETESLLTLKRSLYLQGIAGNISAGTWERMDEAARLPGFNLRFHWQRDGQYLLGKMWSSRDGKGRGHFPMIVCAHVIGLPMADVAEISACLDHVETQCADTQSAASVRSILTETHEYQRNLPERVERTEESADSAADIGDLSELADFRPGAFHARHAPAAKVIRLNTTVADLAPWSQTLHERLDRHAPVLITSPLYEGADWVDVMAASLTLRSRLDGDARCA